MQPLHPRPRSISVGESLRSQLQSRQQRPNFTRWRTLICFLLGTALAVNLQPAIAHPGHSAFTEQLVHQVLTSHFRFIGLGIAFLFGMAHALSPGHGKAMVAAYLVGARGTPKHAVLLGLITTLTHTLGIFSLGLVVLFATHYILPEQIYPILSMLSGLLVFGVGFWLLDQRLQALRSRQIDGQDPDPTHAHVHPHAHVPDHWHDHPVDPACITVAPSPTTIDVTWRSLLALGISGGMVPCPSALVLLLSAIALRQVAYGMVLVTVFSLGLAVVLIGLGLLVIYAHQWLDRVTTAWADRWPAGPRLDRIQRYLPLASAIAVIAVGAGLTLSSPL